MKIQSGLENGQVLQRLGLNGASLWISGICRNAGPVEAVVFDRGRCLLRNKSAGRGNATGGQFTASLRGIPAGGPYRLELRLAKEKCIVKTFFVGDVWLLAGQSNMEGLGDMTQPASPHPLIRAFSMARQWTLAQDPLHVLRESPDVCHHRGQPFTAHEASRYRRTTRKGVGVGIFFAREMLKRNGVPQGLICAAQGGTRLQQWLPDPGGLPGHSLYESMLNSVRATGQPVAGILWYQGESDATTTEKTHYTERMKLLVAATRRDLRQTSLPWLMVQINRVFDTQIQAADWNDIQEQQRQLPDRIEHLEIVASIDLPLDDRIHISSGSHARLGARLAGVAERRVPGNKKSPGSPRLRKAVLNDPRKSHLGTSPTIDVIFENVSGSLRSGAEPCGFTLVSPDGNRWPYCYKITLHGHAARLHLSRNPPGDLQVHYGHGLTPTCNITDARDLSLPAFGPQPLTQRRAYLPFVTTWRVTGVVANPPLALAQLERPDLTAFLSTVRTYSADGFINEHPHWQTKNGHAYFHAQIDLPEPMKLQFLVGYDGPFRLWLDDASFFTDLKGANPCLADQSRKTAALLAGIHNLTVAMDINGGSAWGFMLRFLREDVSKAQVKTGTYPRPTYSVRDKSSVAKKRYFSPKTSKIKPSKSPPTNP